MMNWEHTHTVYACGCRGGGATKTPAVQPRRVMIRYTGAAPVPRVIIGPASKQQYLISTVNQQIPVDERDAAAFLGFAGDITFSSN